MRRKKKLRATTARRSLAMPDEMDYEEMSEPNMKLSRALLIVLVLHVVAVAGIIAFNAVKTRQAPLPSLNKSTVAATETAPGNSNTKPGGYAGADEEAKSSNNSTAIKRSEERKTDHAKTTSKISNANPGKVYVVAKGDNPVTIARKLKVSEADLLALNHIEDPHRLQIGQKLFIPAKTAKKKKSRD